MNVCVFLGPSLSVREAREQLPNACYLPPVAMGDVYRAVVQRHPAIIAVIDGVFEQRPAVWHKEILFALSIGVRVFGAASMGALRAAELEHFGMQGVGRIFEAYRSGSLEDDDEVAVIHGPEEHGYRALSDAMVNIRHALDQAEELELVSSETATALIQLAKARHYPDRSWQAVLAAGEQYGLDPLELQRLWQFVRTKRPNLKRDDAVALLQHMAAELAREPGAAQRATEPSFHFEHTLFFSELVRSLPERDTFEAQKVESAALLRHVALRADRDEILRSCLLLRLLSASVGDRPEGFDASRLARLLEDFRRRRRLESKADTDSWLAQNRISRAELTQLLEFEAACKERLVLRAGDAADVSQFLTLELKRRGLYGEIAEAIEQVKSPLEPAPLTEILSWYQATVRLVAGSLDAHARELGFGTVTELLSEMTTHFQRAGWRAEGSEPSAQANPHRVES